VDRTRERVLTLRNSGSIRYLIPTKDKSVRHKGRLWGRPGLDAAIFFYDISYMLAVVE
jgi:hypothetical protein